MRKPIFIGLCLSVFLFHVSCASQYVLTAVQYERLEVTSHYDEAPDAEAMEIVAPYRKTVDSIMSPVLGESAVVMRADRPESLLSNFVADVLRDASGHIGKKADMGLCNVGGLRSIMPQGKVTYGDVLEISPFENHLCVVTLQGTKLKELMQQIAAVGGEGISGARLVISSDGQLLRAKVRGGDIDEDALYTIATLDYLAEGNDRMYALKDAVSKQKTSILVRELIMETIRNEYAKGHKVDAKIEGRIVVKEK